MISVALVAAAALWLAAGTVRESPRDAGYNAPAGLARGVSTTLESRLRAYSAGYDVASVRCSRTTLAATFTCAVAYTDRTTMNDAVTVSADGRTFSIS